MKAKKNAKKKSPRGTKPSSRKQKEIRVGLNALPVWVKISIVIGVIASGFQIPFFFNSDNPIESSNDKIEKFIDWLRENGADISSNVKMAAFEDYGYGLMATSNNDHHSIDSFDSEPVIHELQDMFIIPKNVITSTQSVMQYFHSIDASFAQKVRHLIQSSFQSPMVQQDVLLAMYLMKQCSLGSESHLAPYLDILPQKTVPRLDTFSEQDLNALHDEYLANYARQSLSQLQSFYNNGQVQSNFRRLQRYKSLAHTDVDSSKECWDFDSFHRHVSISSSRAMVLYGTKHLTPLADVLNHEQRSQERIDSGAKQTFTLFHEKQSDGSIIVRADRDVYSGEQIFEDYGDLDNSLYLEAHGFVPEDNPFHCASISAEKFLADLFDFGDSRLIDTMVLLKLLPDNALDYSTNELKSFLPDVCVRADGSIDDDFTNRVLTIASLSDVGLLDHCLESKTHELAEAHCLHIAGRVNRKQQLVQWLAQQAYCEKHSSAELDEEVLEVFDSYLSYTFRLAIEFRVEENKVLKEVAGISRDDCDAKNWEQKQHPLEESNLALSRKNERIKKSIPNQDGTLEERLDQFNKFIDSLELPVQKIKAAYIDDRMRMGVIAEEDVEEDDLYLSMQQTAIISPDKISLVDGTTEAKQVLVRLQNQMSDGGFDALIFYLLYETLVRGQESKWSPYIQILPTLQELQQSSPLFFEPQELDQLQGSDVKFQVERHQLEALEKFQVFAKDVSIVRSLGLNNVSFDNYLWAFSIVHSRSIWWDGKRHLVPLLDQVNCKHLKTEHGSDVRPHATVVDKNGNALTKASTTFKKGEQVFEHYSQPNHIYFTYHGFIIEENNQDCLLINSLTPALENQKERLLKEGFGSFSPSFCITADKASWDKLSDFLRIQNDIIGDKKGFHSDVIPYLKSLLNSRLRSQTELSDNNVDDKKTSMMQAIKTKEMEIMNPILDAIGSDENMD
ncbi:hypothetical protein CTEN210_06233 [Chaetoceros tenuissimus]|uniref:SET domain-containing protein n=1 Tax=Chaetoceros tenuissimus TaxID=426638 RepID=A0AAD3H3Z4_9STRA|nr:hypothetical protein CTEN210_06233 [Chaetoceros tenuissimus]